VLFAVWLRVRMACGTLASSLCLQITLRGMCFLFGSAMSSWLSRDEFAISLNSWRAARANRASLSMSKGSSPVKACLCTFSSSVERHGPTTLLFEAA